MFTGVPGTIFAVAALIIACAFFLLVWRRGFQRVDAKLGALHVEVAAVNKAVNNVPPGTPPIPQRMTVLEERSAWQMDAMVALAAELGYELPPRP